MFGLGVQELLVILVIVLLLFGARRLPEIGRSLGGALKGFKRGVTEEDEGDPPADSAAIAGSPGPDAGTDVEAEEGAQQPVGSSSSTPS